MDKSVRAILVEAYESGYEIKVEQDELLISGQSENIAVIDRIREHKPAIIYMYNNIPMDSIERNYLSRLRKGHDFLGTVMQRLKKDPDNQKLKSFFLKQLMHWDLLEAELRRIYPEYRDCPVNGCTPDAYITCTVCK